VAAYKEEDFHQKLGRKFVDWRNRHSETRDDTALPVAQTL
jgi:hypothetical protein